MTHIARAVLFLSLFCTSSLGQSLWEGGAKFDVIPKNVSTATAQSKCVMFQDASDWFKSSKPTVADFASVERVEVEYGMSADLAAFISKFPKLNRLYIGEMQASVDFELVIKPFAKAKDLRWLEVANVDVTYRDLTVLGELRGLERLACDVILSEKELLAIQKLRNLRHLNIMAIDKATKSRPVRFLHLKNLVIDEPRDLNWFDSSTNLKRLLINGKCTRGDLVRVSKFRSLTEVGLRVTALDDMKPLAALTNLKKLEIAIEK